ncbi:hypothetical protein OHB24_21145 [Kribbella sp. NBC_00482]|uniref:hypothetical protein n=1 Tax=Kribbella sp. NBC_00482 TaxID=2975968 RepID=UPI002E175377
MMRRISAGVLAVLAVAAAMMSPPVVSADPGDDPGYGLYPQRDDLLRSKGCTDCVTDQPVKIDITGTADLQAQVDSIAELLSEASVLDGGLSWDADTRTVVVRLVGPVDRSSPAVEQMKSSVRAAAKGFTVEFQSVKYSRAELEQLSYRLFSSTDQWAPGLTGAGGGWNAYINRVEVWVPAETAESWTERVTVLNDARVVIQTSTLPAPYNSGFESG